MKKIKYRVLSPDGFDTQMDGIYTSQKAVKAELNRFADSYKAQGYYSQVCYNGYRRHIEINMIPDYCEIVAI